MAKFKTEKARSSTQEPWHKNLQTNLRAVVKLQKSVTKNKKIENVHLQSKSCVTKHFKRQTVFVSSLHYKGNNHLVSSWWMSADKSATSSAQFISLKAMSPSNSKKPPATTCQLVGEYMFLRSNHRLLDSRHSVSRPVRQEPMIISSLMKKK